MVCKIRKWELSDAKDLAIALSNRKIQDNLRDGLPYLYTEQDGAAFISSMLSADENETFAFAITVDGKAVGSIGVFRQANIHRQTAELGYYLAEEYWGRGIMTEAVKQICEYVFRKSDMIRIYADPFAYNTASCRVLEKAGFRYEGTLRKNAVKNGKTIDMKMYSRVKFDHIFFISGTAYAGKSTMVKRLAAKYNGIACEENYHDALSAGLDKDKFPCLTYTRDLQDWHDFIRRTPDEYEAWIKGVSKECEILELQILEQLDSEGRMVFVDTNISIETLKEISDRDHVLIMLADPDVSVNRFFERPDREKQFLYRLLMEEENPELAMENFRQCLKRINSPAAYDSFLHSGFRVIVRDESRSIEETLALVERELGLQT